MTNLHIRTSYKLSYSLDKFSRGSLERIAKEENFKIFVFSSFKDLMDWMDK